MAIKAVTMYQSEDGKVHTDIVEARKYDSQQRVMSGIKLALATATPSQQWGLLHMDLCNNPSAAKLLRDQLNKVLDYHRNYGKLKKAKS